MIYFVILSGIIILFSYLTGVLFKNVFNFKFKYFSFNSPLGFLIMLGILQVGFFLITYLQLNPNYFKYYTSIILKVIGVISLVKWKWIIKSIEEINISKALISFTLCVLILLVFSQIEINFRLDDLNFYAKFIPNRIYQVGSSDIIYSYQGFFVIISLLIEFGQYLSSLGVYTEFYNIAILIWVPAILTAWMLMFTLVDLYDYVKHKVIDKKKTIFLWSLLFVIFVLDYWYFSAINTNGTLRRLAIPFILILIETILTSKEKKYGNVIAVSLILGAFISISSSGFFLGCIVLVSYLIYSIITNRSKYMQELLILSVFPISYLLAYIKYNSYYYIFAYIVIALYICAVFLIITKIDIKIEKVLNKYCILILLICFIIYITLSVGIHWNTELMVSGRTFFSPINFYDMVPDLINSKTLLGSIFNVSYWLLTIGVVSVSIFTKKINVMSCILLTTVVLFFNPFVFSMVACLMTGSAYFRITDILFNFVILLHLFIWIVNSKYKFIGYSLLLLLVVCRISDFTIINKTKSNDYNYIYHTSDFNIKVMEKLDNEYLINADKEKIIVASQIYGGQFFTNNVEVINVLEDRFSHVIQEFSEFERVFYRRQPGYDDLEVNYDHACSLANEKKLDFVILDAQYNWKLQEGLWSCSELLFEEDMFRVLKMNYEYWNYNIKQGFVKP